MNNSQTNTLSNTPKVLYWEKSTREETIHHVKKSLKRVFKKNSQLEKYYTDKTLDRDEQVDLLLQDFFPNNLPINYYAANLSLTDKSDKKITLSLRAPNHGNFIHLLEANTAISISGYWPTAANNPKFIPENIFISHNDDQATHYEIALDATPSSLTPERNANNNVLTPTLAKKLPLISVKTAKNLNNWIEFIEFKRQLVKQKQVGIRYLNVNINQQEQLVFVVLCPASEDIKNIGKIFQRKELEVFNQQISTDSCYFKLKDQENKKSTNNRDYQLGQIQGSVKILSNNQCDDYNQLLPSLNIDSSLHITWGQMTVELTEDWKNKLNNASQETTDDITPEYEKLCQQLLQSIPEQGFISFQSIGDLALANRHERVIKNLMKNENCYSPYLSTYLFDIKQAGKMAQRPVINKWFNNNLQDAQKEAVIKMIGSPDLCLIQGPPGTGKTTVIAEAILQLAARGEKVLLASQAHDAIDNALSRIQNKAELRAIRLARYSDKITEEGQQFSEHQALSRYYDSLRTHTEETWLTPYKNKNQALENIKNWLNNATYMKNDIVAINAKKKIIDQQLSTLKAKRLSQHKAYHQASDVYESHQLQINQVKDTINSLENCSDSVYIAENTLTSQAKALAEALFKLSEANISLDFSHQQFIENPQGHGLILSALLKQWFIVQSHLSDIQNDILSLKQAGSKSLKDRETEQKISQLNKDIKHCETTMEQNDSPEVTQQWRQLRKQRTQLEKTKKGLKKEIYGIFSDHHQFTDINNAQSVAKILETRIMTLKSIESEVSDVLHHFITELKQSIDNLSTKKPDYNLIERIEKKITALSRDQEHVMQQLIPLKKKANQLLQEQNLSTDRSFSDQVLSVKKYYEDKIETNQAKNKIQKPWNDFFQNWVDNLSETSAAHSDWEHINSTYTESCNLFAISCNENDKTLQDAGVESFDVVIIDEVSKATPIEMLLPLMRARRAVLVGDHRQLPPVFQESHDAQTFADKAEELEESSATQTQNNLLTRKNIKRFENMVTASLFKAHFEAADDSIRERLSVQYRMHPEIMQLVNKFYEGQLICGNPELSREHGLYLKGKTNQLLTPQNHVLWIDTSNDLKNNRYKEKEDQTNPLEAQLIAETLMKINQQMLTQGFNKKNKQKVGVVSFYVAQCRVIRHAIRKVNHGQLQFDAIHVEINTVIRYQGKEKPIILISLVRNDGQPKEKRRSARANVARFEFINVAISRAQNLLILFGARNMLECRDVILPNMDSQGVQKKQVYREIFAELDRAARIFPASEMCINHQ